MTPSSKKKFNTLVGGLFLGLGVLAWGMAAVFALKPSDQRRLPPVVLAPSVDINSCRQALTALYGFTTRLQGVDGLVVVAPESANPQETLDAATGAIGLCKRELVEFCMGRGCPEPGMTMTLAAPANQAQPPRTAAPPPRPTP